MADYKNIPLGLRTQTQIPLDVKEYIQNESLLSNLGVNGQLAYTYTKGLVVYCIEESTRWEWTEVKPGLEDTGLINQDFIYPDNHIAFGIDYSNKRYNFVKVISGSETKINAGTNINITGNGTIATPYIINSSGGVSVNQDNFIKYIEVDGFAGFSETPFPPSRGQLADYLNSLPDNQKTIDEYSTYRVGLIFNLADETSFLTGYLPKSFWYGKYYCIFEIINVGKGILPTITEDNLSLIFYQEIRLSNQDSFGVHINSGNNTVITGDGSYQQPYVINSEINNLQKVITTSTVILDIDNNNTIFINNGATPITITIDSSITIPNFCVGFIQEGTGDVTFVGTGVSLTNPVGLKSKGQGYATFVERKLNTSNYFLLGDTKN